MTGRSHAVRESAASTKLILVRGNSGSGKSTIAAGIRAVYGRGIAIVGQDNLRREVLRERDRAGAANVGLIGLTARYALEHGFHVVVEGILYAENYAQMLLDLRRGHVGASVLYYLDVPFDETLRRHATKPNAGDYGETEMADWYRPLDLLPGGVERIISAGSSLTETVGRIVEESGLLTDPVPQHATW